MGHWLFLVILLSVIWCQMIFINYRLTQLQPIYEDYVLDYSLEFDVEIDKLSLYRGLFREKATGYVFNYGHNSRFKPGSNPIVRLQVVTPEMDTITASTTIPESIEILNAKKEGDEVSFDFELSERSWHNYFMINVNTVYTDTTFRKIRFLDYSHISDKDTMRFECVISDDMYGSLELVARRLTKDNYDYQISLENAKDANSDHLVLPSSLAGNLNQAIGIFTCYTQDSVVWRAN